MNVSDALHFLKILSSLKVAFKRGTQSMLWLRTQQNKSESFRVTWKTRKTVQKTFIWKAKGRKHSPDNKQLSWFQKTLKMDVINNLKELSKCNITWIFCEGIRGMGGGKRLFDIYFALRNGNLYELHVWQRKENQKTIHFGEAQYHLSSYEVVFNYRWFLFSIRNSIWTSWII